MIDSLIGAKAGHAIPGPLSMRKSTSQIGTDNHRY